MCKMLTVTVLRGGEWSQVKYVPLISHAAVTNKYCLLQYHYYYVIKANQPILWREHRPWSRMCVWLGPGGVYLCASVFPCVKGMVVKCATSRTCLVTGRCCAQEAFVRLPDAEPVACSLLFALHMTDGLSGQADLTESTLPLALLWYSRIDIYSLYLVSFLFYFLFFLKKIFFV